MLYVPDSEAQLNGFNQNSSRQFYLSQTEVEQAHIQSAYVFELSKVEHLPIRERLVSHLLNIDETLANKVAEGLGLQEMPDPITKITWDNWNTETGITSSEIRTYL
mgnify:CR=1 FL=1